MTIKVFFFSFFLQLLLLVLRRCRRRFFFFYFCCRQHQVSPRNSLLSTHKIASLLGLTQYIKMAQPSCISCTKHTRTARRRKNQPPSLYTWSWDARVILLTASLGSINARVRCTSRCRARWFVFWKLLAATWLNHFSPCSHLHWRLSKHPVYISDNGSWFFLAVSIHKP